MKALLPQPGRFENLRAALTFAQNRERSPMDAVVLHGIRRALAAARLRYAATPVWCSRAGKDRRAARRSDKPSLPLCLPDEW
jgi:hypothetical protein